MKFQLLSTGMLVTTLACGEIPLPEHPRPDFERAQWLNLNGEWDFRFKGEGQASRKIMVPFGWGTKLSGVKDEGDVGCYRREVKVPTEWKDKRVFVIVGAADHDTTCVFDGEELGKHSGGYTPFEFEITDFVRWGEAQALEFEVWDPPPKEAMAGHYLYGKQGYGNIRGIWQTVYLEARGKEYVDCIRFASDIGNGEVIAVAKLGAPARKAQTLELTIDGKVSELKFKPGQSIVTRRVKLVNPRLWTLDDPYLYEVKAKMGDDRFSTYFGFREIGTAHNSGVGGAPYVTLNGKPIYLQLTLDQSWNPNGWFTYPSDAEMKREIEIAKELALTGNRVHIKVEQPRKIYWADKLGLLIQADVPCAWGNASEAMFREHWNCFEGMVKRDFNHPSIYQWTLFNETWGLVSRRSLKKGLAAGDGRGSAYRAWTQRAVADCYLRAKLFDPTRLIEDNSPCSGDHVVTDVNSWHAYNAGYRWESVVSQNCKNTTGTGTANYIGGHVQNPDVPMMNSECGNVWGYSGSTGDCDFTWDYHQMMDAFRRHPQCAGWLYTEHHDVINEWNGYVRADRTWKETGIEELFPGMSLKDFHSPAYLVVNTNICHVGKPGSAWKVPVDISLITDEFESEQGELAYELRYLTADGNAKTSGMKKVSLADARLTSWRHGKLAEIELTMPEEIAAGTLNCALAVGGKTIARNFTCFRTRAENEIDIRPTKAEWSLGTKEILGGLKQDGFGSGYFEYEFEAPKGEAVFCAEMSTKRLNGKDASKEAKDSNDLDWMLGGGEDDRSKNPNSYPQTSVVKYPGMVRIVANGTKIGEIDLPDDPADHRGILSWNSQKFVDKKAQRKLHEAGSYGYFVRVKIPESVVKASVDGKLRIRLEAEKTGLAVYGPDFGRYPTGPRVTFK